MSRQTAYVTYPDAVVFAEPREGRTRGKTAVQHLIWGDEVVVETPRGAWRQVIGRRVKGWLHESFLQPEPLLEVNFVDIGQGDGCILGTPAGEQILIDAGERDNMFRFLRWRFRGFRDEYRFKAAILTHPDQDHYYGFRQFFEHENVFFDTVYHSGIVERKGDDPLGATWTESATGRKYLAELVRDMDQLRAITDDPEKVGRRRYPSLLKTAVDSGRVGNIRALWADDAYLPGFEPDQPVVIQVLAPVVETPPGAGGKPCLRWFDDVGKTKNGHSVVLRLTYGKVSMLLGGDLNIPAEHYLLHRYTGLDVPAHGAVAEDELVAAAQATFGCDIAKACHHGSADFSEVWLRSVNAVATVISSGDNESHSHPRPDTLGALGRYGRGVRPLIFSTELARSAKENIKRPFELQRRLLDLQKAITEASTEDERDNAQDEFKTAVRQLERSVAVYGMITLRTDGRRVLFAQKLEKPRSKSSKWDLYPLEPGADGRLRFRSKHH